MNDILLNNKHLRILTQDLDNEINFDIMADQLVESGWVRVEFLPFHSTQQLKNISHWVKEHSIGQYHTTGVKYVFKSARDATATILKWQ